MIRRLRWWRRGRDGLVCRDAVALMAEYLDGALDDRDRSRLEAHLSACPHCSEHLAQLRATIDLLGRIEPDDIDDHALEDLVAVYRSWQSG